MHFRKGRNGMNLSMMFSLWVMLSGGFLFSTGIHYLWGEPGLPDFVFRYGLATVFGNLIWTLLIYVANGLTGRSLRPIFYWPYYPFAQIVTLVGVVLAMLFTWLVQRRDLGLVQDYSGAYYLGVYGVLFALWVFAVFSFYTVVKFENRTGAPH